MGIPDTISELYLESITILLTCTFPHYLLLWLRYSLNKVVEVFSVKLQYEV
jgi:hypothetical protein